MAKVREKYKCHSMSCGVLIVKFTILDELLFVILSRLLELNLFDFHLVPANGLAKLQTQFHFTDLLSVAKSVGLFGHACYAKFQTVSSFLSFEIHCLYSHSLCTQCLEMRQSSKLRRAKFVGA